MEGCRGMRVTGRQRGEGDPNIPEKLQIKSTLCFDFERQVCSSLFFFLQKFGIKKNKSTTELQWLKCGG